MKVFEDRDVSISYDEDIQTVSIIWNGIVGSDKFREVILKMLAFVKTFAFENASIKLFADTRKLSLVNQDTVRWMAEEIDPQLYKLGVTKAAFIVPESIYTQMSIAVFEKEINKNEKRLMIMQFSDTAKALEWLQE